VRQGIDYEPAMWRCTIWGLFTVKLKMRIGNQFGMARYGSICSAVDQTKKELLNNKVFIMCIKEVEKERSIGGLPPASEHTVVADKEVF